MTSTKAVLTLWIALVGSSVSKANSHPLYLRGSSTSVAAFLRIVNGELPAPSSVEAILVDKSTNEYGIRYIGTAGKLDFVSSRQDRFSCAMNYLLGDSTKSFRLRLVENHSFFLISDGLTATLDISDIERFNTSPVEEYSAGNVLVHELYEQYFLQVVQHLRPGKVTSAKLKKAHFRAMQKESNLYDYSMLLTSSTITQDDYIYIEFTNRFDSSLVQYYAYYSLGNITRVEVSIGRPRSDKAPTHH